MATIYAVPDEIKRPKFDFRDIPASKADEQRYIKEVETFVKNYHPDGGEHIGKMIDFPVADSKAVYMIASMKPLQLVHLQIGDCWQYQYDHRLKKADVELKLKQKENLDKMFEENRLRQLEKNK